MNESDVENLRREGRRRGDELVGEQDASTLGRWRRQIERGFQQAERGEVVDGSGALANLRERLKARKRPAEAGEDA